MSTPRTTPCPNAPYTSSTTEAINLGAVKTVVVNRMVADPRRRRSTAGVPDPSEAVLSIGWGALNRIDLEPATCSDPNCEADHGYTGVSAPTTSPCASLPPPKVRRQSPTCSILPGPLCAHRRRVRAGELDAGSIDPAYGSVPSSTCCLPSDRRSE